ncbi:MAG TPA: hypothetical protein VKT32_09815 [Chthonomonadaceae bacterium]|nr:hypothetical protein [Chthonomonadaceae bacterium]
MGGDDRLRQRLTCRGGWSQPRQTPAQEKDDCQCCRQGEGPPGQAGAGSLRKALSGPRGAQALFQVGRGFVNEGIRLEGGPQTLQAPEGARASGAGAQMVLDL